MTQDDAGNQKLNQVQDHFVNTKARDKIEPLPVDFGDVWPDPLPNYETWETETKPVFTIDWKPTTNYNKFVVSFADVEAAKARGEAWALKVEFTEEELQYK